MSAPHSGTWIGTAVNLENGSSAQFVMNIKVSDDGSFTGEITPDFLGTQTQGRPIVEGRYSPYGTLHIRYAPDHSRVALFDGRFQAPDPSHGVMWGTMLLSHGDYHQRATASFLFLGGVQKAANGHVWGK
jgi:hypothetical protein